MPTTPHTETAFHAAEALRLPAAMRAALLAAAREPLIRSRGRWRAASGAIFVPKTIDALRARSLVVVSIINRHGRARLTVRGKSYAAHLRAAGTPSSQQEGERRA